LRQVDREVANSFEVIGDFQRGDDQAHLVVGKQPRRNQRMACSSITISISLMRGSRRNTSLGVGRARAVVGDQRVERAAIMAPSTVRAMETR